MTKRQALLGEGLLTIAQAAAVLNVSPVSLRRWTDAGRLPCVRIGAKRERRFRREDLLDFGEHQRSLPADATNKTGHTKRSNLVLEGIDIHYGAHLCALYEGDLGRLKLSVPFLADGLRAGDICYLVAAGQAQRAILDSLGDVYNDTEDAIGKGRLIVSGGMENTSAMCTYFEHGFATATRFGNHAIRVLGDMGWTRENGMSAQELLDFEIRFNHSLAHQFPVVTICQYDTREFSGTAVLAALKSHADTLRYPLERFLCG